MDLVALLGDAAPHLSVTREGGIATVAFSGPDKPNAISYAMWLALARLLPALGDDDAVTAQRVGLVHEVVEAGAVQARAYALAATLSSRARVSLVGAKQLVARSARGELEVDDDVEALYRCSWDSAEYDEGVAAFPAKRPSDFASARAGGTSAGGRAPDGHAVPAAEYGTIVSMTDVGATLGVEEEYHLVDAGTMALADAPGVVPEAMAVVGEQAQGEISTSQLEVVTTVLTSLAGVREELTWLRREADAAAQRHGCRILPAGTHPFSTWHDQRRTSGERYDEIQRRLGHLALQQLIAGTHVHVVVPERDLAVQVLDRLRPDLPVLLALSGSSPFWEGVDTAYASWRTQWFARFPVTGSPELLRDGATYDRLVTDLVASGVVEDASHLYWDARVSTRFPTVEIRVADTCPHLDDVVLQAGLARSLVRTAAAAATSGTPFPEPRAELVRAARWLAAKEGLEGRLLDLHAVERRPAVEVVRALLVRQRDDLEASGEWDEVSALAEQALARGTAAAEQRRTLARTGDLAAVTRGVVDVAVPA